MTRGVVAGLESSHPLGSYLPDVVMADVPPLCFDEASADLTGTYVSDLRRLELDVDADSSVSRERLRGFWVLKLTCDPHESAPLTVALFREGRAVGTGTVTLSGRRAVFTTSECGDADGAYQWALVGDVLSLTPVDDPCGSRMSVLAAQAWQRQSFMVRLMSAFDDALAPIFASLDNLDAYVDPRLAPRDFVDWLSGWVALTPNHGWPLRHRRERIAGETQLSLSWGTVDGIKEVVSIFAGVPCDQVEIEDTGAVEGSSTPGANLPDGGAAQLLVRVRVPDPSSFDVSRLRRVVATAKPAHLPHEVEVLGV